MKKCKVQLHDKKVIADFYGIYQYSKIVDLRPMRGRLEEGIITLPIAVVDFGRGLEMIDVRKIKSVKGRSLRNFFRIERNGVWNEKMH